MSCLIFTESPKANLFGEEMSGTAIFSQCQKYRYWLTRMWSEGPRVTWLMLNPSTADAFEPDPTIRRCIDFSKQWGYGRLIVVNLFAYRSPYPKDLPKVADPVGPENNDFILRAARESDMVMCAWGALSVKKVPVIAERPHRVHCLLESVNAYVRCLGYCKDQRSPKHPLYLSSETKHIGFIPGGIACANR